jgi:hypothetical protein
MNANNPATWSEELWSQILAILASYIRKWSGPDSPMELSPEARDEVRSRIIMDVMTGTIPEGMSPLHYVFRTARKWRMKNWAGDTETDTLRKRGERAAARKALTDPGSRESEEGRNKSPFRGMSDDSRQPTPLAMMVAMETATREGLVYISDRQRKARRKPVKGKPAPVKYRVRATGFAGRARYGFGRETGKPLYFPGARTLITFDPLPQETETGPRGKPHIPYAGTLANRAIGKTRAAKLDETAIGQSMARMAILGRDKPRAFIRQPIPMAGVPATQGDGTEWRSIRE